MANDIHHFWGGDISAGSNGDLMQVSGSTMTTQRILRRLMTNPAEGTIPADYPAHPDYGAGLPRKIGSIKDVAKISALIRGQMMLEPGVKKTPEPAITVTDIADGIAVQIQYADAVTNTTQTISFNVTA